MNGVRHVKHPESDMLRRIARGARVEASVSRHVDGCTTCTNEVTLVRFASHARKSSSRPGPCPDAIVLARHASGDEGLLEDDSLQGHLTACFACASDFEALHALEASEPGRRRLGAVPTRSEIKAAVRGTLKALRDLVRVEMPLSLGLTFRDSGGSRAGLAKSLAAYRNGDHASASEGFARAIAAGEQSPEVRFLLAACELAQDRTEKAIARLVLLVRSAPRSGEYRWFLAQALLASDRGEEALKALRKVSRLPGSRRAQAAEQAKQVAEILAKR